MDLTTPLEWLTFQPEAPRSPSWLIRLTKMAKYNESKIKNSFQIKNSPCLSPTYLPYRTAPRTTRCTTGLRYVGLRSSRYKSTKPHHQDLSISYAQSDSEKDDVDSRVPPTCSQTVPKVNGCTSRCLAWPTGPQRAYLTTGRGCSQIGGEEP